MAKNWTALIIKRALELIRSGWAKKTEARNARGVEVDPIDPEAVRFCAVGAIKRAAHDLKAPSGEGSRVERLLEELSGRTDVEDYNDDSPNSGRVIALFEKARKRA